MATGRTTWHRQRTYVGGYNLSGYTSQLGPLTWEYEEASFAAQSDEARGYLPGRVAISPGALNGVFDNTATSGLHVVTGTPGVSRVILAPIGIRAAPAAGDPAFCGRFQQRDYKAAVEGELVTATLTFDEWDAANLIGYDKPWGVLLHALGAETGANTASGVDDNQAATSLGGYLVYQIIAYQGTGSATISVDDSANNTDWAALSGATTGAIAHTAMPTAGIVALGKTATVRRYLRWQLSLSTLTSVTFALAFVRETRSFA